MVGTMKLHPLWLAASLSAVVAETKSWTLYHSLNGQEFSPRGVVEWSIDGQELDYKVVNNADAISTESVQAMLEYGWYQVKLQASDNQDDFVLATVPACNLLRGNLRDEFHLTMSRVDNNRILSLSYQPLVSPLAPKTCEDISIPSTLKFESKLELVLDTPSMTLKTVLPTSKPPPGLAFKANRKGSAGGAGPGAGPGGDPTTAEPEPITGPTSFIRRYWYVLLPLFLANFVGGAASPEGGEGAGAAAAGGAAVAGAAAAASSGSPVKKVRRGKTNK